VPRKHRALSLAMNGLSSYIGRQECARALFGSGQRALSEVSQLEAGEAFWLGSSRPTYTRVSAVLFVESLIPWTLAVCEATLFYHPWAVRPLRCELDHLPHVVADEEGRLERRQGKRLSAIWGLHEGWPRHTATEQSTVKCPKSSPGGGCRPSRVPCPGPAPQAGVRARDSGVTPDRYPPACASGHSPAQNGRVQ
jgi:hypothetical protein